MAPDADRPVAWRRDWRDTARAAADVAVLGVLVTLAAVPLVTAGASVATGSAAVHHYLEADRWPRPAESWAAFRRTLGPGFVVVLVSAVGCLVVALDVAALRSGVVPGGWPLVAVTLALAVLGAGYAGCAVVAVGAGYGWRAAARGAWATRPVVLLRVAGIVVVAAVLAVLVHPVLIPVLAGYALYAMHVVVRSAARVGSRHRGR